MRRNLSAKGLPRDTVTAPARDLAAAPQVLGCHLRCRDRILGNPRFLLVLAIEEAMGVSAKLSAELNARGDNFKKVPALCRTVLRACWRLHEHRSMWRAASLEPAACRRACVVLHVATPTNAALQEMNFVLSDLALEVVGDAAIVWLLSPKAAIGPRPAGGLSRLTSSLPGYFLQVGVAID